MVALTGFARQMLKSEDYSGKRLIIRADDDSARIIKWKTLTATRLITYIAQESNDEVVYISDLSFTARWQRDSWRPSAFGREEVPDDGHR